jgi:hypothetical protein
MRSNFQTLIQVLDNMTDRNIAFFKKLYEFAQISSETILITRKDVQAHTALFEKLGELSETSTTLALRHQKQIKEIEAKKVKRTKRKK